MDGLDERELFEEFIATRANTARVFVHGRRPLGLTVHIGPKTKAILLFLLLTLPLPGQVQSWITLPLQRWSTSSAVFSLETLGYALGATVALMTAVYVLSRILLRYGVLLGTLDRMGVRDPQIHAAAVRHADRLARIKDRERAAVALDPLAAEGELQAVAHGLAQPLLHPLVRVDFWTLNRVCSVGFMAVFLLIGTPWVLFVTR